MIFSPMGPGGTLLFFGCVCLLVTLGLPLGKLDDVFFYCLFTLPETNIATENPPFRWYLLGKMGIFMDFLWLCWPVSLPEGNISSTMEKPENLQKRLGRGYIPGEYSPEEEHNSSTCGTGSTSLSFWNGPWFQVTCWYVFFRGVILMLHFFPAKKSHLRRNWAGYQLSVES